MTGFAPTDPYHRFYLHKGNSEVDIVHVVYKVTKTTRCGAWIQENSYTKERWVGHTRKAFAYQDVGKAWSSFKIRMNARLYHAENEYRAVKAAILPLKYMPTGPETIHNVLTANTRSDNDLFFTD